MNLSASSILRLLLFTLREPRAAANLLMDQNLPREVIWPSMMLVAVVSSVLYAIQSLLEPAGAGSLVLTPVGVALFSVFSMVAIATSIQLIGSAFGGAGGFWNALILITFMQAVLISLQILQSAVSILTTAFSGLFMMVGLGVTLWLLINFTAALHGYSSLSKAFGVVVLAFFATGFVLAIALGIAGVGGA